MGICLITSLAYSAIFGVGVMAQVSTGQDSSSSGGAFGEIGQEASDSICTPTDRAQNSENCPSASEVDPGKTPDATGSVTTNSDELDKWLQNVIDLLSGLVALAFVVSFIIAGYQYMSAGGNASQVAAAKARIGMTVLAFVVFVFGYGLLQWLVPGGIF